MKNNIQYKLFLGLVQIDAVESLVNNYHIPIRLHRAGQMMFCAEIMGSDKGRPFREPEGIKMTSTKAMGFLTGRLLICVKRTVLAAVE